VVESALHPLELFLGLVAVVVWAYVLNKWWGGEWWSLLLAIAAAVPVGVVFSILPSVLLRALRRVPVVSDAVLTWVFIVGGLAVAVFALIAFEGTTLAMVALAGAEIVGAGIRSAAVAYPVRQA
jgi:hypothetical protein